MTLNYQLTLDDYVEANKTRVKSQPIAHHGMTLLAVFGLLSPLMFYYWPSIFSSWDFWSAWFFFALGVFIVFTRTFLWRWQLSSSLKKNPAALAPILLSCSAEQLEFETADVNSQVRWNAYISFAESQNLLMLYVSANLYEIIPKRAFTNENDLNQFRAWASQIGNEPAQNPPLPAP